MKLQWCGAIGTALAVMVLALPRASRPAIAQDPPPVESCTETIPNPATMQFCGGVQNTCADVISAPLCTGSRKVREKVTQDCIAAECWDTCRQEEVICWKEYQCQWDEGADVCENGIWVDTSTTMAKVDGACMHAKDCESPRGEE